MTKGMYGKKDIRMDGLLKMKKLKERTDAKPVKVSLAELKYRYKLAKEDAAEVMPPISSRLCREEAETLRLAIIGKRAELAHARQIANAKQVAKETRARFNMGIGQ